MSEKILTRPLGRTGLQVSVLALGGVKYNQLPDAKAAAVVSRAIDLGITYIDTGYSYTDSERKIGQVLPERRGEVAVASKTRCRDRDGARREIDESLRRLRTDTIDVYQVHQLMTEDDLTQLTGPDGALKAFEEARAGGAVRFIGVTGHTRPEILVRAMEEYPFDTVLCALGPMHAAVRPFHETVVPAATARGVGVLGMKVMAYAFLTEHAEAALRFVAGQDGISAAVVGMDSVEQVEANVAVARNLTPLSAAERDELLTAARDIYERRKSEAWFIHK